MLVFAGNQGVYPPYDDLWELSFSGTPTWTKLTPSGTPPFRRQDHTAIYDPVRDRVLVFAGFDGTIPSNDVWALSLSGSPAWTQLTPSGTPPTARWGHSAIYDPVRDRMLVFGGYDGHVFGNDVWSLSLSGTPAWTQLTPSGTAPLGRWEHTTIYDPVRDRMILYGGVGLELDPGVTALELTGGPHWTTLSPSGTLPAGRSGHAAFYDPPRDRMVVAGGDDLWALSFAGTPTWSALPPEPPISRRSHHAAIMDPVRDRILVFGGNSEAGSHNDLWELPLSGPPDWNALTPSGTTPPRRHGHSALYDPVRDRMIVFGGLSGGFFNDVRLLSLAGTPMWSMLIPSGSPPLGRYLHSAIYDPVRDRMIVFGGYGAGNDIRNDTWELTLSGASAWSMLEPAGVPPAPRYLHAAVYDPEEDRMLVFGGADADGNYLGDLWALSLSGAPEWTLLEPAGPSPAGRQGAGAVFDPVRNRVVVFGGTIERHTNEVWSLTGSGAAWEVLTPSGDLPPPRFGHSALYDAMRDEMVVFGGTGSSYRNDVWKLSWSFLVDDVPMPGVSGPLVMLPPRPNPMHSSAEIRYELAAESNVSLEVLDIQGRIVRRLRHGVQPAGSHHVKLDRRDDHGRALPAGIYLIRLGTGEAIRTTRIVLLP